MLLYLAAQSESLAVKLYELVQHGGNIFPGSPP